MGYLLGSAGNVYGAVEPSDYVNSSKDWVQECTKELEQVQQGTATGQQAKILCEKYLMLLTNGDIGLEQYITCLKAVNEKFNTFGVPIDYEYYYENGVGQDYAQQLSNGDVRQLYDKLRDGGYLPTYPTLSKSESLMLGLAQYTACRWANGQGVQDGLRLRYSQALQVNYLSDLTNKNYMIRADCSGLIYTLLNEIGCRGVVDKAISGFNTQTMVNLCKNGVLDSDPRIEVLDFNADRLRSGDIVVTSVDEPLTKFGTSDPYVGEDGIPIRKGHTEVFIGWANRDLNETVVWSWGSNQQVESEFTGEKAVPLVKSNAFNYSYIIRFMGGFEAWEKKGAN